jgi:hypothetical protein
MFDATNIVGDASLCASAATFYGIAEAMDGDSIASVTKKVVSSGLG